MIRRNILIVAVSFLFIATTNSCNKKDANAANAQQQSAQPYQYIVAEEGPATAYNEYPASLEGEEDVEIRPKIDGFIEKLYVDEGDHVSKGQLLMTIRNPQYEQLVRVAQAAIESAQADVATAQMQVTKTKPLVDKGIISSYELQNAELALRAKQANLAQAQANLVNARVNQGYTRITSPVDGYVGDLLLREGSYVSSATAQPLTKVSRIGTIYAYFSVNEKDQLDFLKHAQGATVEQKLKNAPAVTLVLSDGTTYKEKGKIASMSGLVNKETGSFRMRADFPNPNGVLRSGYSATIQVPTYMEKVFVIPQSATYDMQGKIFTYIIGKDNKVKSQEVQVSPLPGGQTYAVSSGLKEGDKVVVEGVGILRDGTEVVPKQTTVDAILIKPTEEN